MNIPYFEVLAFTNRPFAGNPAGVCLLDGAWLRDDLMQKIAAENQLPETAFLVEREDYFDVRWFAPAVEIDLCGHATLASPMCSSIISDVKATRSGFNPRVANCAWTRSISDWCSIFLRNRLANANRRGNWRKAYTPNRSLY